MTTDDQPMELARLFGHEKPLKQFINSARSGRLHHAWIIAGASGIGKATFACRIARALVNNLELAHALKELENDAVMVSRVRKKIELRQIFTLSRQANGAGGRPMKVVSVDSVRAMNHFLQYKSTITNTWQIVIVDKADDLNKNAANALLKNLEEPPSRTLFLIVCDAPGRLPATVRSRCNKLSLKPLDNRQMKHALTQLLPGIETKTLEKVSAIAGGRVGLAIRLLSSEGEEIHHSFEEIIQAFPNSCQELITSLVNVVASDDQRYQLFLELVSNYFSRCLDNLAANSLGAIIGAWTRVEEYIFWNSEHNMDRKVTIPLILSALRKIG